MTIWSCWHPCVGQWKAGIDAHPAAASDGLGPRGGLALCVEAAVRGGNTLAVDAVEGEVVVLVVADALSTERYVPQSWRDHWWGGGGGGTYGGGGCRSGDDVGLIEGCDVRVVVLVI